MLQVGSRYNCGFLACTPNCYPLGVCTNSRHCGSPICYSTSTAHHHIIASQNVCTGNLITNIDLSIINLRHVVVSFRAWGSPPFRAGRICAQTSSVVMESSCKARRLKGTNEPLGFGSICKHEEKIEGSARSGAASCGPSASSHVSRQALRLKAQG